MTSAAALLDLNGVPHRELLDDLTSLIRYAAANAPRSQQRSLGPSEVGHPCARKLALGLMDEPRCNPDGDPLPSIVGTAVHAWLEAAASTDNERLGRERWITERRVTVREGLSGTCDLYDQDTATCIDWKCPGTSRMKHYVRHGPSQVYRVQAHLYGRGYRNAGLPVERVAVAFLPRGGQLRDAHLWTEPYDDALVDQILERIDLVQVAIADLDVEHDVERYLLIPKTPDGDCIFCPFFSPKPKNGRQCSGPM